jgi:hypothetical protein
MQKRNWSVISKKYRDECRPIKLCQICGKICPPRRWKICSPACAKIDKKLTDAFYKKGQPGYRGAYWKYYYRTHLEYFAKKAKNRRLRHNAALQVEPK